MTLDVSTLSLCASIVFMLALGMNLVRKNTTLIGLYILQSFTVASALFIMGVNEGAVGLLYAGLLTLIIKVGIAPVFLGKLIRKYSIHFSASSYLSMPLALSALAITTGFSYIISGRFVGTEASAIPLLFATIFCAFFLMINRRGTLSIVLGVLSLENGVVLLSSMLGNAHTFALEFMVAFDIAVWILIASVFLEMLYRQFGVVETSRAMSTLTEEE
ncbi:hypothetical protein HY417_02045 [Candidatus Kaiserbacteria bacterium]|nr:hypothetical protein [Candidatus Kaiserbacteria bacterium]